MKLLAPAVVGLWVFIVVVALGELFIARASAEDAVVIMPYCQFEDGNPDGQPCLWIHPRTGVGYVNDGHNYRD